MFFIFHTHSIFSLFPPTDLHRHHDFEVVRQRIQRPSNPTPSFYQFDHVGGKGGAARRTEDGMEDEARDVRGGRARRYSLAIATRCARRR